MELLDQYVRYQNICTSKNNEEKELLRLANSYASANSLAPVLDIRDAIGIVNKLALDFYSASKTT